MFKNKIIFDDFVFHGRVMPVLTVLFPLFICAVYKGVMGKSFMDSSLYIFLSFIFLSFVYRIAREVGKRFESKMYEELGGLPTTIVMRFTDNTINNISKVKYHKVLSDRFGDISLPLCVETENDYSDAMYEAVMNYLRKYANDNREAQPRVYQELKDYNYWRNLYGMKLLGIFLYIIIGIREIALIDKFSVINMIKQPYPDYVIFLIMMCSLFIIVIFVNKETVKRKAFDYAKALVEMCESM